MKKIYLLIAAAAMCFASCGEYLDIVPDQVAKVEDLFATKTDALDALAKVYWYLPALDNVNETPYLLGNEYVCSRTDIDNDAGRMKAQRIMRDLQSSNDPLLGIWESDGNGNGGKRYYVGMRHCDLVINHVDLIYDMTDVEKREMKAQVKFLKAYYAFMLIKQYGPIVIPQYLETDETDPAKLFPARVTIDESFDYVIALIREAIPDLRVKVPVAEYGQVDQTVAKAILARVMVYRASPFFNGNTDFFSTFKNAEGIPFFPQEYNREKWQDAIAALDEAIQLCEANGISLFKYSKPTYYSYDSAFVRQNPIMAQNYYNRRFVLAEPWNTGLIWGRSDFSDYNPGSNNVLSNSCNIILPKDDEYSGAGMTEAGLSENSDQILAASYQMLERYYTENGLPIDQDRTYANGDRHAIAYVPKRDDLTYNQKYIGLMQPGDTVIKLLLNREVRFYADLVITGGYSRAHRYRIKTSMFLNEPGGRYTSPTTTNYSSENYLCSGIGVQKMVHPESASGQYFTQTRFPYPFIRLADLYLMRAEALNEYQEQPDGQVWEDVNRIRRQYGIPDVNEVWANPSLAVTLNKHTTKAGMRDIILQERSIELAFEGIHYWDMVRHNRAITEFSQPIKGWNTNGRTPNDFFLLRTVQARRFPRSSYLWPISVGEININSNLINNPGWQ